MALVTYSESEESDSSSAPISTHTKEKKYSKPSFRKFVSSDGHKIRVEPTPLHQVAGADEPATEDLSVPKRRRLDDSFSPKDFNALLPPPKNNKPTSVSPRKGETKIRKGSSFTLRTAAEPAFMRNATSMGEGAEKQETSIDYDNFAETNGAIDITNTSDKTKYQLQKSTVIGSSSKSTIFKPLSVARTKSSKRKVAILTRDQAENRFHSETSDITSQKPLKMVPKTSLFSIGDLDTYTPGDPRVLDDTEKSLREPVGRIKENNSIMTTNLHPCSYTTLHLDPDIRPENNSIPANVPQNSLLAIAEDLSLPESARRQLFGRKHGKGHHKSEVSEVNVVNFNTDNEYAANEELRAAGETVQHNPVRSVAPGKHSLRQLVSSATTQKDALEEHFANGRRNRKEAGGKYGW